MPLLHPGDTFPELTLTVPGGQTVTVPEAFAGQFGVLLLYRGSWCPYCNAGQKQSAAPVRNDDFDFPNGCG
jgi:peroxiredoxin